MLPDRVSNPGPLTYESSALPIALRGPAKMSDQNKKIKKKKEKKKKMTDELYNRARDNVEF